ncbi:ubiA prenyltransferase family domain-containing protein [Ditylenchus destructor]|nr:ubiA prenyltransferase family domain-containing protein [Ditylenchus destructor]
MSLFRYACRAMPCSSSSVLLKSTNYRCLASTFCSRQGHSTFPSSVVAPIQEFYRKCSATELVKAAPKPIQPYLRLMRVDKPIGTWLLYWPCCWSIALATPAGQLPSLYMLSLFGAGAFFMRSAGCVINDLWDRDFDKNVERTKIRPLASGELSEKQAVVLLSSLLSVSLGILLQLNWLSVFVGASSMALVIFYPLAKRYTYWPQFVLGCTFNWGALLGYTAVSNQFPLLICLPLYISGLNWTLIYDTIYAHQDKADDIMIGVKSTALRFGDNTKFWLSGFSIAMISSLGIAGLASQQTWPFYAMLAAQLAWQVGTVRIEDGSDCWRKFRSNQWLGVFLFTGIVASNLLKRTEDDSNETLDI